MSKKTILVLGAQGLLGRFTAQLLQAAGHKVLRGGRHAEDADDFRLVDLDRMETFNAACKGVDLVVSSIEDPQMRAERAILRHGGVLLSQATLPAAAQRQLRAEFAQGAKGTVFLNSGLTGTLGLVIKDLLLEYPASDTIQIGFIASVGGSMGLTGSKTAHGWFTSATQLTETPLLFSPPRGLWPCFDMNHIDFLWFSEALAGKRKVRMYIGLAEKAFAKLLKLLGRVGLLHRLPQAAFTGMVRLKPTPTELTKEPIRIRAALYQGDKLLAARGMEAQGDYRSTTLSTALFAQALLGLMAHQPLPAGVSNIEEILQLKDLQAELTRLHILIRTLAS